MDTRPLEQALALSHKMLQLAQDSEWNTVDALDAQRRDLLELGLAGTATESERPLIRRILQEIEAINNQTLARVSQGKAELYESMQLFRHRQDAASAYISCEKDSI